MIVDSTNTTRNDSLATRTDTRLQSLLVWSSGQQDIIKAVTLAPMILNHANRILYLDQTWMFLTGRGAFPLSALVWGLNLPRHAHIRQSAINRPWEWGTIVQFAYHLAGFPRYRENILSAFTVTAQVLTWCGTCNGWRIAAVIPLMAPWGPLFGTSYGIAGLLMLAVSRRLYRAEDRTERLVLVVCLLAVIPVLNLATNDAAAVTGLVMAVLTVGLMSYTGKSLPRFWPGNFFPIFYACHLAVLGVLALQWVWYLWPQEDDLSEAEHSITEQKRPVLTLKRKAEGRTPVHSRKTIINVTAPPKQKVKRQKLAEKATREVELAVKKAQAR